MVAIAAAAETCFRVLANTSGRFCLWPAAKSIPAGWREALAASSKKDCLAFIGRSWTQLRVRPARIEFGLMFFGGDEGKAAQDKYRTVIEAARFADAHGFSAVWLPERHFTSMGSLYPNPVVLHAALRAKPSDCVVRRQRRASPARPDLRRRGMGRRR